MVDGNANLAFDNCSTHNIQIFLALKMIPWFFIELGNCNDLKGSIVKSLMILWRKLSWLVAAPLNFEAKKDFLCAFYVVITWPKMQFLNCGRSL